MPISTTITNEARGVCMSVCGGVELIPPNAGPFSDITHTDAHRRTPKLIQ